MTTPNAPPEGELERFLFDEIQQAREENRPISRRELTLKLHQDKHLRPKEAFAVVEQYCDESAPMVPEYLSSEFAAPYLKVLAIVNSILGLAVMGYSATMMNVRGKPWWIWALAGVALLGSSAFFWGRSLLRERNSR